MRVKKAKHQRLALLDVLAFSGTILPKLLRASLAYITISVYVLVRVLYSQFQFTTHISLPQLAALTTFVSFLLVFVNSTLFQRFFAVYTQAMTIQERIFDLVTMAQSFMTLSPEMGWRLLRYVNAAHVLGYVGLHGGKVYGRENFLEALIAKHHLLTDEEVERIEDIDVTLGGAAYREVLTWATEEIKEYLTLHKPVLPATDNYRIMITVVSAIRAAINALYEYADQPIPFIYMHLINLTVYLYLPLFAYCVATAIPQESGSDELLCALILVTTVVIIVGIRLVGDAILDPFGPEVEDLTVLRYVTFTLTASRRIYLASNPTKKKKTTLDEELCMEAMRPDVGAAWANRGGDGSATAGGAQAMGACSLDTSSLTMQAASPEFLSVEFAASAQRELMVERSGTASIPHSRRNSVQVGSPPPPASPPYARPTFSIFMDPSVQRNVTSRLNKESHTESFSFLGPAPSVTQQDGAVVFDIKQPLPNQHTL